MKPEITVFDETKTVDGVLTCNTPAGAFSRCMKIKEGTALNILEKEYKYYAPAIGLVRDGDLRLVKYGFVKN